MPWKHCHKAYDIKNRPRQPLSERSVQFPQTRLARFRVNQPLPCAGRCVFSQSSVPLFAARSGLGTTGRRITATAFGTRPARASEPLSVRRAALLHRPIRRRRPVSAVGVPRLPHPTPSTARARGRIGQHGTTRLSPCHMSGRSGGAIMLLVGGIHFFRRRYHRGWGGCRGSLSRSASAGD